MKPTVIRLNEEKEATVKPTVMPSSNSSFPDSVLTHCVECPSTMPQTVSGSQGNKNISQVTVMSQSDCQTERKMSVQKPTAIPGFSRKRIPVTVCQLGTYGISLAMNVLEKARSLVEIFDEENLSDRIAVMWGADAQAEYGRLVHVCLSLSQSPVLSEVSVHLGRLIQILDSIDLEKICDREARDSLLSKIVKKATHSNTIHVLKHAEKEIGQLLVLLQSSLSPLLAMKEEFERVSGAINALATTIEIFAISASYLADYLVKNGGNCGRRFSDRRDSLVETLNQLRASESMRAVQIEQPLRLIGVVQHVALIMVPTWLPSVVLLRKSLEANRKPTETELSVLGGQLAGIVGKLKN